MQYDDFCLGLLAHLEEIRIKFVYVCHLITIKVKSQEQKKHDTAYSHNVKL